MREPRRVDISELVIQRIENQASDNQSEHQQQKHRRMEHPNEHSHMVQGKQNWAEEIGKLDAYILFQRDEPESSEEKLFEEGIHNGYVDCYADEVIRGNSHSFGQAGCDTAEIDNSAQSKIPTEDDSEDSNAERERNKKSFLSETEQGFEFAPFITVYDEEQHRKCQEKENLYRDFGKIRWVYNGINKCDRQGKQKYGKQDVISFSCHRQSHFSFFYKACHNGFFQPLYHFFVFDSHTFYGPRIALTLVHGVQHRPIILG